MGAILSMTGYGRGEVRGSRGAVAVEVRSLNHRFLEINVKLPRGLSAHEPEVRRLVQKRAARGRFDVTASTRRIAGPSSVPRADLALGREYARSAQALAEALAVPNDLGVADLIRLPGVLLVEEGDDGDGETAPLLAAAVGEALDEVARMRETEGAVLAAALGGHVSSIANWADELVTLLPAALGRIQERMRERIQALLADTPADPGRLAQEIATWAAKSDVAEELARLASHVEQVRRLLQDGGAVGRQLDFLAQELHREVNTIAAKADDQEMTVRVLEARTLVERLREQVQNVE